MIGVAGDESNWEGVVKLDEGNGCPMSMNSLSGQCRWNASLWAGLLLVRNSKSCSMLMEGASGQH